MENKLQKTNKNEIQVASEKWLVNEVSQYIAGEGKSLALPKDYDAIGAAKSFHLKLQGIKDLEKFTTLSIKQAAFEMISKGLDPRKNQCYLIPYANEIKLQVGSFGNQRQAFAFNEGLKSINAQVIRKGDVYETGIRTDGSKYLVKHSTNFTNRNSDILGAYAIATFVNGNTILDDMSIEEIHQSWSMSRAGTATHKKFPVEMCRKTVKSRLAKALTNVTSDDMVLNQINKELAEDSLPDVNDDLIDFDETPKEVEIPNQEYNIDVNDIQEKEQQAEIPEEDMNEFFGDTAPPEVENFDEPVIGDILTVKYPVWINDYKPTGEWKEDRKSYDPDTKTIQILKIA